MADMRNLWEVKPCCALDPEALDTVGKRKINDIFLPSEEHVTFSCLLKSMSQMLN